jgi:hypothetical protein
MMNAFVAGPRLALNVLAALLLVLLFIEPSASLGNFYVAPDGSDAGPGTLDRPFRTLARGVRVLTPGATLYVRGGTYAEALINNIPGGTSWSAPVTVTAYPGEVVVVQPRSGEYVLHFQNGHQQFIVIDGLILDGVNVTEGVIKITTAKVGDPSTAAHHIRIQNSEVKNTVGSGIYTSHLGADFNEFINLNVHHNGWKSGLGFGHGLYIGTSDNLIERCQIHHNNGYGIQIYNGFPEETANRNLVRGNDIYDNSQSGSGRGLILSSGDGNLAYNNVIRGHVSGGIIVDYKKTTNTRIFNNTITGNHNISGFGGIWIGGASDGAIVQNNILYNNGAPEFVDNGRNGLRGNNLIGIDPLFRDSGGFNFRLRPSSPANRAGTRIPIVREDFDGTMRDPDIPYDIGAFTTSSPEE